MYKEFRIFRSMMPKRIMAILMLCCAVLVPTSMQAVNATKDSPVKYLVRSELDGGVMRYNVVVADVYAQTYQSWTITYPSELELKFATPVPPAPAGALSTRWFISYQTSANGKTKSATFIIKTGTQTASEMLGTMQSVYFNLVDDEILILDNSTVSITASPTKVTTYMDPNGYVHYYEFVPFQIGSNGKPVAGANPVTSPGAINKTWWQAYNIAKGKTMQDPRYPNEPDSVLHGYLATITSEEEQMKVYSGIADWSGWLGGTRMVFSSGAAKIQDNTTINEATFGSLGASSAGVYSYGTSQTRWYWASGPEAWTVYNGGKYTYYPKGWTTVYNDTWIIRDTVKGNRVYLGRAASEPIVPNLGINEVVEADPNRDSTISPLEFYKNHVFQSPIDHPNPGVYHNFNNPTGGMLHFYDSTQNKAYCGKTRPSSTNAEPNGTTTEFCLQFAYPSTALADLTIANNLDPQGDITITYPFKHQGKPDTWNDYSATNTNLLYGYFIEYGGYPGDPKIDELGGSDVSSSSEVEIGLYIKIEYRSTVTNGSTHQVITSIGKTADYILTWEQHLPYLAERNPGGAPEPITGYTPFGYEFVGQSSDKDNLAVNASGDISGFFSPYSQRIIFLYKPDNLTVYFDANFPGATSANVSATEKTVSFDSPYGTLPIATQMGYEFAGWFTDPSTGTIVEPETMVATTTDHTLYAQWQEKNGYTVKYDVNGATSGSIPDENNVNWWDDFLLPAEPTRTGYIFTGWNVSVNGSTQGVTDAHHFGELAFSDQITFITLQAQWQLSSLKYVVIYHTNGSTSHPSIPNDTLISNAVTIPMPTLTKTGYTFGGWAVENDGEGGSDAGPYGLGTDLTFGTNPPISLTENFVILSAIWTPKTYTVKYAINDGSPTFGSPLVGVLWNQVGLVPSPDGNPIRTGYLFMGWNTLANGSGKYVFAGDSYGSLVTDDNKMDTTFYAQWLPELTYFVRYDLNGSPDPAIPDKTGVLLADNNLLPTSPNPPNGYDFSGWTVTFNGTKQGVTNTDRFVDLATNPNEGYIMLEAQWSPKSGLTIKYDSNGGNWAPVVRPADKTGVVWTQTHLLPLVEPTRAGYTFAGWNTLPSGLGTIATGSSTYGSLANNDTNTKMVTLYAQWVSNSVYIVRYNLGIGSGNIPTDTLINETDMVKAPLPTAPPGYVFLNWRVEDNGYGQGTTMIANGSTSFKALAYPAMRYIVLIAEYTVKNTYKVIYDHNIPGSPKRDTLENVKWTDQTNFVPCPFPVSRPGYSLLGWTTKTGGGGITVLPSFTYGTITGGIDTPYVVLYAHWEIGVFTVRYDLNGGVPPSPEPYVSDTVGFDDADLVPPSFARAGYVLTQWNISENGFGINVQPTDRYRDLAGIGAQYITLQAQWGEKSYNVIYDENGSSTTYSPQTGLRWWTYIEYPLSAPTPPPGYSTFLGWKLSAIGATDKTSTEIEAEPFLVSPSIKFSDLALIDEVTTTSITIQAQYDELPNIDIKYIARTKNSTNAASGGTVSPGLENLPPATGVATGSIATPNPGYHLVGWFFVNDTLTYNPLQMLSDLDEFIPDKIGGVNYDTTYVALFAENDSVTIKYAPITVDNPLTPTLGGTVTPTTQKAAPATGNPSATATPETKYYLVGWFYETDILFADTLSKSLTFYPPKDANGLNVDSSYIALFCACPSLSTPTVSNSVICQGGSTTIGSTLSNTAVIATYQWQYYNVATWENVMDGTPTGANYSDENTDELTVAGITVAGTHAYRLSVTTDGGCDTVSIAGTFSVEPLADAGNFTFGDTTICYNTGIELELENNVGALIQWQDSTKGSFSFTNRGTIDINTFTTGNLIDTTWYRVLVKTKADCKADTSILLLRVDVLPHSVWGNFAFGDTTICYETSIDLELENNIGALIQWQDSTKGSFSFTNNGTGNTINTTNLIDTTWYRVIVKTREDCKADTSSLLRVDVLPHSGWGNFAFGDTTICYETSIDLELENNIGALIQWQDSTKGSFSFTDNGTGNTINTTNLIDTTWYRVIVKTREDCKADTSDLLRVDVLPHSVWGNFAFGDTTICYETSIDLELENNIGALIQWQDSTKGSFSFTNNGTGNTINTTNLIDTTWYRVIVKTRTDCKADTSSLLRVDVLPHSGWGNFAFGDTTICYQTSIDLELENNIGALIQWQDSTKSSLSFTNRGTIDINTFATGDLIDTTWYRVIVKTRGDCKADTSSLLRVDVFPHSVWGNFAFGDTTICYQTSIDLELENNVGALIQWQDSTKGNPFTNNGTGSIINTTNLIDTTWYRVIVKTREDCKADTSSLLLRVDVLPHSVWGNFAFGDTTICYETGIDLEFENNVGGLIQWQDSIKSSLSFTNRGTIDVNTFTTGDLIDTTWYRVIVKTRDDCKADTSSLLRVDVLPHSFAGNFTFGDTTICNSTSIDIELEHNIGGLIQWQDSIDGIAFSDIGTGSTFTSANLIDTTWYRVIVKTRDDCKADTSSLLLRVAVHPDNIIALLSVIGTDTQSVLVNTAIVPIVYATTDATGATFDGLPAGVSGVWLSDEVTISGTPTVSGIFNYTVTLTGGCGTIKTKGLIAVIKTDTIEFTWKGGFAKCFDINAVSGIDFDVDWGDVSPLDTETGEGSSQIITYSYSDNSDYTVVIAGLECNEFTALNVAGLQLSALDVSRTTALKILYCENNQISDLKLPDNNFMLVQCYNNSLQLSDLYALSEKVSSPYNKRLGTQHIEKTITAGEDIDFSTQEIFGGVTTIFLVDDVPTPLTAGKINFPTAGTYTVKMTNAAITSHPSYPAEVIMTVVVN